MTQPVHSLPSPVSIVASAPSHPDSLVRALVDALHDEERLLGDLVGVLRGQREAIARDDLTALDESVFSTHRVLFTLGAARRRRRTLGERLGEPDDLSMQALLDAFHGAPPPALRHAIEALTATGLVLHRELDLNQRVLKIAVDAGDQLVRAICGAPAPATTRGPASRSVDGALLDLTI